MYKEDYAGKAVRHTKVMNETSLPFIMTSVKNSKVFGPYQTPGLVPDERKGVTNKIDIVFINTDTVGALMELTESEERIVLLNFASYKNPGGQFLRGSTAQEEMLCHESFLYNVLCECGAYYEWNQKHLNYGLYTHRALYTPDICFKRGGCTKHVAVITCASPNMHAVQYHPEKIKFNKITLEERAQLVCEVATNRGHDIIILGAWGCGVFRQSPNDVIEAWNKALNNVKFNKVVMAVPGGPNDLNRVAFEKAYGMDS